MSSENKDLFTEIVETASEYVSDELEGKVQEAVEKAIIDILRKYGKNISIGNSENIGPIFTDQSVLSGEGSSSRPRTPRGDAVLDSATPRGGKVISSEFVNQVLLSVVNENAISPTNPLTSFSSEYESSEENAEEVKGKKEKKAKKERKPVLDWVIGKQDNVNERLNKVGYAGFLNMPGIAQMAAGKSMKQTVVANTDQKPIPVVIVTDLNHSESRQTRKARERREKEKQLLENLLSQLKDTEEEKEEEVQEEVEEVEKEKEVVEAEEVVEVVVSDNQ